MEIKNLMELLEEHNIEIPMLQRDYAQGRKSQVKIANEFLDAIFNVLDSNGDKALHIDFIYGNEKNNKFLLIDGQQRITTLWLLHFYLYKKSDRLDEIKKWLKKFSYKTRKSSSNFCKNLLNKDFDIAKKPSEAIIDMSGEFEKDENLRNDPTIKAMLNMLDLIFDRTKGKDVNKFILNLDKITFNIFNMGIFKLGDDLYIKMNARGKQLSLYENLKAFIEQDSEISQDRELLTSIDTDWSDYFFDSKNADKFDDRGHNFLHYSTIFFQIQNSSEYSKKLENYINNSNIAIDRFYEPLQNLDNIKLLDKIIQFLFLHKHPIIKDSSFFDEELTYKNICYFYSILFYVKENNEVEKINKDSLNDYLRVCKHFIENNRSDSESYIKSFYSLFEYFSKGSKNIYEYLIEHPYYETFSNMYNLEVRKAGLILESRNGGQNWEEVINKTSDHNILVGWIDFLLDFCDDKFELKSYDNSDFYEKNEKQSGYISKYKNPNLEKFIKYANLTMRIFDKKFLNSDNLPIFQRAFMSIGNYGFYSKNYFYGNYANENYRDREAWNWILSGIKNDNKMPYFKIFLDYLIEIKNSDLIEKMQCIIEKTNLSKKSWCEYLLIKQKGLFEFLDEKSDVFQRFRRVRFFNDKVELLPGVKNRKNIRDLLDYGFYLYCKELNLEVSEYESDEEQYHWEYKIKSHFKINKKIVICHSGKKEIQIAKETFKINLNEGIDIFSEFKKILIEAKIIKK